LTAEYPLFVVWKSGLLESICNVLADKFDSVPQKKRAASATG